MKARVKVTGEIVDIIRYTKSDNTYYDSNWQKYYKEELSFHVKEKSFPKDEDYWTRLEHQYAGMAMQGVLTRGSWSEVKDIIEYASKIAHALVEKYKEKEERK